jgi:hypothetical protein
LSQRGDDAIVESGAAVKPWMTSSLTATVTSNNNCDRNFIVTDVGMLVLNDGSA